MDDGCDFDHVAETGVPEQALIFLHSSKGGGIN